MDNDTPIYDISMTCDRLFVDILSKPDAASVLVAEVLHQRFKQWASYLGVFAPENVSLDTRLKYSESISQLVLQFLQIASRNLDRIGKLDEALKANDSAGECLQRSVAEEVDHTPESGASSPLAESLRALQMAIDGLYRLGVAIRQQSSSTLNQRISDFAQENDDVAIENMVFFRLKYMFFDKGQNESNSKSPLSLYRQLAMSISFRYFGLLYRRRRQEKIEKNRETTPVQPQAEKKVLDQKSKENIPPRKPPQSKKRGGPNELKKLAAVNAGMKQQPERSEGAPTTVNTKIVLQKYAATEKSSTSPISVLSAHIKVAKYPDPPKVDPRTREARCPFCGRPIIGMDLKKDWWHRHLDQDLKLYTCLSETCAEPPQLFIRFHEWSQHMDEHHSTNWMREIHKPLGWCCDVEHNDLYFDDEDEYDRHVQETHPEYEAEKADLKEWGELQRERPPYTCPICNSVPEELAVIFPWLREGKLANPAAIQTELAVRAQAEREEAARDKLLLHIGTHLKQLGLMSVAYLGNDADSNSMGSKRGSIPVDKDGKALLVENPPDYFDPQFEGYVVPTEPKLLEEGVDWSYVKNVNVVPLDFSTAGYTFYLIIKVRNTWIRSVLQGRIKRSKRLEGHSDEVYTVVFSPDGSKLASGSGDWTVRVWDVATGKAEHTLEGHSNGVSSVIFSPDGSKLASGSWDRTVLVWDVATGKAERTLKGHSSRVSSVVFSPDGSKMASGSGDWTVRVWDVATWEAEHTFEGHWDGVLSVIFSPDGSKLASGSWDRTVRVWDAATGQAEHILEGHSNGVYSVAFSPDGSKLASGSLDRIVLVWDVATGQAESSLEGYSKGVSSVVFSPDGSKLASGSWDRTVRVWDVATGQTEHTLEGHSKGVSSVVFSPDGSKLASGSLDRTVRVWDVRDMERLRILLSLRDRPGRDTS